MSLLKHINSILRPLNAQRSTLQLTSLNSVTQVRTATKKVSGSKTNKNDSAGRRLGPKAYEGHLVKPGQIIMRQRGTKIHPGENVKIGVDHTIYAVEPGYVRFYYDPFHPLRKYVGVALKKELKLPTPHFAPRVRRFGYVEITDAEKALQEENQMSRKEYEAQPEITKAQLRATELKQKAVMGYTQALVNDFHVALEDSKLQAVANRFYEIAQFVKNGQSIEEAKIQATFNYIYQAQLAARRGENEQFEETKAEALALFEDIDSKVEVDAQGNLTKYLNPEARSSLQSKILSELETYTNRILSTEEKKTVAELIETPGAYTAEEQSQLSRKYLPEVVPLTVPGSVVENIDPENPPKGLIVQRIYDELTRSTKVVGRPREVVA